MRWFDLTAYDAKLKQAWSPKRGIWFFMVDAPESKADRPALDAALGEAFAAYGWGYIAPRSTDNARRLMQLERAELVHVDEATVTMGGGQASTPAGEAPAGEATADAEHGEESDGDRSGTSGPIRPHGGEELAADEAGDGEAPGGGESAAGDAGVGGSDDGAADRPGDRESDEPAAGDGDVPGDGTGPGAGPDAGGGDDPAGADPAGRGNDGRAGVEPATTPEPNNPEHFALGDLVDREGGYEPQKRFRENQAAIEVLQRLQEEQREPDDDERATIARYNGWGGLAQVFEQHAFRQDKWAQDARQWLETNLSSEQYTAARAATLNSHYTAPEVVRTVWDHVRELGFTGGRVLEPAAGIGYFLGLAPDDLVANSRFTAVENDPVAGPMLAKLYPDADVRVGGFEHQTDLPNGGFDLVIGNVPFGNYSVSDPDYPNESIHNQFILRSLDKLKPGGVLAVLTSSGTMDARQSNARKLMDQKGSLAGAIRLPDNAFKAQAGTEVATDLLVFVRRDSRPRMDNGGADWISAASTDHLPGEDGARPGRHMGIMQAGALNDWWFRHPEMVSTQMTLARGMRGRYRFTAEATDTPAEALRQSLAYVVRPDDVPSLQAVQAEDGDAPEPATVRMALPGTRREPGALVFDEQGNLARVVDVHRPEGSDAVVELESAGLSGKAAERAAGIVGIRDALDEVFRTQIEEADEDERDTARETLNKRYDEFIARHGYLHVQGNRRVLSRTPDAGRLLALEHWDAKNAEASKADIFSRDVIDPTPPPLSADTPLEALGQVLNQTGDVDGNRIARALDRDDPEAILRELSGERHVFFDPQSNDWMTASAYLSGNVREKLRIARDAAQHDRFYQRNVESLEEIVPADLGPSEIDARIGAPWLTEAMLQEFIADTLDADMERIEIYHSPYDGRWQVNAKMVEGSVQATYNWGTKRRNAINLIERMLNGATLDVYDTVPDTNKRVYNAQESAAAHDRAASLQAAFEQWLWYEDEARAEQSLERYNELFNAWVPPKFDGSHLTFPGLNPGFAPRENQRNAVWRNILNGRSIPAHEVGTGKTFVGVASAMEWRRLGICKRPTMVIPNHMIEQIERETRQLYPTARILTVTKDDLKGERRQQVLGKAANNEWDVVIIPHSLFDGLDLPGDFEEKYYRSRVDELRQQLQAEDQTTKAIENRVKKYEQRLSEIKSGRREQGVTLEDLGVDGLIVDEFHHYKNLAVEQAGEVNSAIPGSKRAEHLNMVLTWLRQRRGDYRGLCLMSGTPVSNNVLELFNCQRYIQPDILSDMGLNLANDWAHAFLTQKTSWEPSPSGTGWQQKTRFALHNAPELMRLLLSDMEVVTAEDVGIERPSMETENVVAPMTENQVEHMEWLSDRCEKVRGGTVRPDEDNLLAIVNDGRKLALDTRLIEPSETDAEDERTTVRDAAANIATQYHDNANVKGAQLVFCDLGTPTGRGFSVYDSLRETLVEEGIPREEIAFIHEYPSDDAKGRLFSAVRSGQTRVLIGSTAKMGEGVNVQDRLSAVHHLDPTWRPSDIDQRDGRAIRQGNLFPNVKRFIYTTEGTFDAFMWETMRRKNQQFQLVMRGDPSVRRLDPDVDPTFAETAAITSADPKVKERLEAEAEVDRLETLKASHDSEQDNLYNAIRRSEGGARRKREYADRVARLPDPAEYPAPEEPVESTWMIDRSAIDAKPVYQTSPRATARKVGEMIVKTGHDELHETLWYQGRMPVSVYSTDSIDTNGATLCEYTVGEKGQEIDYETLRDLEEDLADPQRRIEKLQGEAADLEHRVEQMRGRIEPFARQAELEEARSKLRRVESEIAGQNPEEAGDDRPAGENRETEAEPEAAVASMGAAH